MMYSKDDDMWRSIRSDGIAMAFFPNALLRLLLYISAAPRPAFPPPTADTSCIQVRPADAYPYSFANPESWHSLETFFFQVSSPALPGVPAKLE